MTAFSPAWSALPSYAALYSNGFASQASVAVEGPLESWPVSAVAATLLDYLARRLQVIGLRYRKGPVAVGDGWETCVYWFHLARNPGIPKDYRLPLNLRVFSGPGGIPVARDEFKILRHMRRLGYPVPRCIHREDDCSFFDGPFLLQEHVAGSTILELVLHQPWRSWLWLSEMARAQVRLHRLPLDHFPKSTNVFPASSLQELARLIQLYELDGLQAGCQWALAHAPPASRPRILHLDFHPMNLIWGAGRGVTVLDWPAAARGDPHADVATTMMLMECAPVETCHRWEALTVAMGRELLSYLYLRAYQQRRRLDLDKLRYYQAWAALRRLVYYGRLLRAGPQITGSKPSLLRRLQSAHLEGLAQYFEKWSGVPIHLKGFPHSLASDSSAATQ